jgi:hypothetical protein
MVEGEVGFGRFRLDLARRELRRDERLVRLGSASSAGAKALRKSRTLSRALNGRNRRTRTTRIARARPILRADVYTALIWRLGL